MNRTMEVRNEPSRENPLVKWAVTWDCPPNRSVNGRTGRNCSSRAHAEAVYDKKLADGLNPVLVKDAVCGTWRL